jgi:hypothetical protein
MKFSVTKEDIKKGVAESVSSYPIAKAPPAEALSCASREDQRDALTREEYAMWHKSANRFDDLPMVAIARKIKKGRRNSAISRKSSSRKRGKMKPIAKAARRNFGHRKIMVT